MNERHLGGHNNMTHIDIGALSYLIKEFSPKTMLDIGCGPGGMVLEAKKNKIEAVGIDGFPGPRIEKDINIIIHDFTKGSFDHKIYFDLGWSCEFVEHVEEKYQENYMNSFSSCRVVAMTFAPPNTPGHHHVNCRTEEYWIEIFSKFGFRRDEEKTLLLRKHSTMQRNFVRKNGILFIKG